VLLYLVMCSLVFVTYYMDVLIYIGNTLNERVWCVMYWIESGRRQQHVQFPH